MIFLAINFCAIYNSLSATFQHALISCVGHEVSFGLGDEDSNGLWSWLICDILAKWPLFRIIWWVCGSWVAPGIVGLPPDVVVIITSLDDCDDDVELMRVGEFTRMRSGDTWADGWTWLWFKWWCNMVCGFPFCCCPLATQAIIAAIAAFCGNWGWGRINPTGKLYPGWFWVRVADVPVCEDDGVMPIGGEWVGDALSPKR